MDEHQLQQELEALAGNAFDATDSNDAPPEPIANTMARWSKLFNLSQDDAVDRIMDHRNNLTRTRISDAHWDTVRQEKEAAGYDREAYEYELGLQKKKAQLPDILPSAESDANSSITYLVELSGPFDAVEKVQHAAGLEAPPPVVRGNSAEDHRPVSLCCVDAMAKTALLHWCSTEGAGYEPTILVDPRSLR